MYYFFDLSDFEAFVICRKAGIDLKSEEDFCDENIKEAIKILVTREKNKMESEVYGVFFETD